MHYQRLLPLLIAGAACVPLAACGGDEEPSASATPNAPAETSSTPPGGVDATSTAAAPPASSDADRPDPAPDAPKPGEAPQAADGAVGSDAPKTGDEPSTPKSPDRSTRPPAPSSDKRDEKQQPAQQVPKALEDYAKGGAPATADEAKSVRDSMLGFRDALVAQDAAKACSYTLGLPAKSDPSKPTPSCEALVEGSKTAPPTDEDRKMIMAAKITVNDDRASIEMGDAGVPMPFRKVDGRWRIDYGTLLGLGGSGG